MAVGDRKILLTQTYADATFDRKDNITDDNNTYDSTKSVSAKALAQLVDRVEILESSVGGTAQSYTLPVASGTTLGGVKIGDGLIMTNDVLSVTTTNGGSAVPGAAGAAVYIQETEPVVAVGKSALWIVPLPNGSFTMNIIQN